MGVCLCRAELEFSDSSFKLLGSSCNIIGSTTRANIEACYTIDCVDTQLKSEIVRTNAFTCIPHSAKFSRMVVFEDFVEIILQILCLNDAHATHVM